MLRPVGVLRSIRATKPLLDTGVVKEWKSVEGRQGKQAGFGFILPDEGCTKGSCHDGSFLVRWTDIAGAVPPEETKDMTGTQLMDIPCLSLKEGQPVTYDVDGDRAFNVTGAGVEQKLIVDRQGQYEMAPGAGGLSVGQAVGKTFTNNILGDYIQPGHRVQDGFVVAGGPFGTNAAWGGAVPSHIMESAMNINANPQRHNRFLNESAKGGAGDRIDSWGWLCGEVEPGRYGVTPTDNINGKPRVEMIEDYSQIAAGSRNIPAGEITYDNSGGNQVTRLNHENRMDGERNMFVQATPEMPYEQPGGRFGCGFHPTGGPWLMGVGLGPLQLAPTPHNAAGTRTSRRDLRDRTTNRTSGVKKNQKGNADWEATRKSRQWCTTNNNNGQMGVYTHGGATGSGWCNNNHSGVLDIKQNYSGFAGGSLGWPDWSRGHSAGNCGMGQTSIRTWQWTPGFGNCSGATLSFGTNTSPNPKKMIWHGEEKVYLPYPTKSNPDPFASLGWSRVKTDKSLPPTPPAYRRLGQQPRNPPYKYIPGAPGLRPPLRIVGGVVGGLRTRLPMIEKTHDDPVYEPDYKYHIPPPAKHELGEGGETTFASSWDENGDAWSPQGRTFKISSSEGFAGHTASGRVLIGKDGQPYLQYPPGLPGSKVTYANDKGEGLTFGGGSGHNLPKIMGRIGDDEMGRRPWEQHEESKMLPGATSGEVFQGSNNPRLGTSHAWLDGKTALPSANTVTDYIEGKAVPEKLMIEGDEEPEQAPAKPRWTAGAARDKHYNTYPSHALGMAHPSLGYSDGGWQYSQVKPSKMYM